MGKIANIIYTLKHKKAFLQTEKKILGRNTIHGLLHDLDKLWLYLWYDKETTSDIHRRRNKHHVDYWKRGEIPLSWKIQMLIDWESSSLTKPDKPLNAHETLRKYYPKIEKDFHSALTITRLGHWSDVI